ncbi:MAG: LysR family transcriptional regulator [Thermoleophilaceae bacterium]|jgi:molybdate transport repressor ModE-like protein
MLDVRRLRVLREVAQHGSFSAAAEELSYTQSAVSQQIAALEQEAGTKVLERGPRGVRLTEAGRALVEHSEVIFARLAAAEAELDDIAGLRAGRMRLASFTSAGATLVPRAVGVFRQRHPGVRMELVEADEVESIPLLRAGELELALVFEPYLLADTAYDGLELVHLLDDVMYAVLPRDHRLAKRRRLRLADLATESWINTGPTCACAKFVASECRRQGFDPDVVMSSNEYTTVQGFVGSGVGIALIPELGLHPARDDVVVRSLGSEAPVRRIFAAVSAGYRSPAADEMVEVLKDAAAGYPARARELAAA